MGRLSVALLCLAACYDAHARPGGACANGACPSGLACIANVCTDMAQPIDAPMMIDARHIDAPKPIDAAPFAAHINIAGVAFTGVDHPGNWIADPGTCDGVVLTSPTNTLNSTNDSPLYVDQKSKAVMTCAVTNVPPGMYRVTLLFAELRLGGMPCGAMGMTRVFDIALEGTTVATAFDLTTTGGGCAATGGSGHPVDRSFDLAISDGTLDIVETASMDVAVLNAIEVVAL